MQIGFLFNHYEPHQVAHSAPIAFAISQQPGWEATIFCSNKKLQEVAQKIGHHYPLHRCRFVLLTLPLPLRLLAWALRRRLPMHKQLILACHKNRFRKLDILVVPESTSLKLRRDPSLKHLRMVRIRHGAGNRVTGLDERNDQFELILASGQKMVDRLSEAGVPAGKCRIVGYPKFDYIKTLPAPVPLFSNLRPVVLYNPHFKPDESSWPMFGKAVLDYFSRNKDYNLIVAPHILLQRHLQPGSRQWLQAYAGCENIHIDLGSEASVDMTYTRMADIYMGDVSSQIYEFLWEPRPCVFLNAHGIAWPNNKAYQHWQGGAVIDSVAALPLAIMSARTRHPEFLAVQKDLFDYTFSLTEEPSADRAARAIIRSFTGA